MKKQELIKTIKSLVRERSQNYPHEEMVELPDVLNAINQLDEPELPVIPMYVSDFLIEVFGSEYGDHPESNTVYNFISNFKVGYEFGDKEKVRKWYFRNIENKQKFEKAWLLKDWIVDNRKYRIKFDKEKYGVRFDKKKLEATLFEKEKSSVFTEDEIFELEQGLLFWKNFAVPVEEEQKEKEKK